MKYSLRQHTLKFLLRLLFIGIVYFTIMTKMSEQAAKDLNNLNKWANSVWHVFISMLTIGFGDTAPITYWGRMFSVFCAVFGFGMFSLLIISFERILKFNHREKSLLLFIGIFKKRPIL